MEISDKPGIGGTTFKITFKKEWFNNPSVFEEYRPQWWKDLITFTKESWN